MDLSQMLDPAMMLKVAGIMIMVNGILLGLHKVLESVAKFTDTKADDNIAEVMGKVVGGIAKIVEVALGSLGKK